MNWDEVSGKWTQLKGSIKEKWAKLTDNDLLMIEGKRDRLVGKLRERYGYTVEKAESEIGDFMSSCGCASTGSKRAGNM